MEDIELTNRLEKFDLFFNNNKVKVEELFQSWYFNRENCQMFIDNSKHKNLGFKTVDIYEAKKHLKLIELYKFIASNDYKFYLEWEYKKRDYFFSSHKENFIEKYNRILQTLEICNQTLNSLNIDQNFDTLYNDFYGKRFFMKEIFKEIFLKYGISLTENALKVIFGRFRYHNNKTIDAIQIITYKTHFYKPLSKQFDISINYARGIFSIFFMRASGLLNENNNYINYSKEIPNFHDPFLQEKKIIKIFAKACLLK
ncbi:hypothetical protein [Chryseobacterium sp. C3]|uniref:hypothetical protein n=1 Tax=Chryseobacterium sp. C3 TaxID=2761532 RepID=UPI001629A80A|nr:hypothetical protein [Chryseobacterium sp. C3]